MCVYQVESNEITYWVSLWEMQALVFLEFRARLGTTWTRGTQWRLQEVTALGQEIVRHINPC